MALTAQDLAFSYGLRRRKVLDNLCWQVPTTGRTILLGPNGAGKSTLLRLLAGALRARHGEVFISGPDGSRIEGKGLRRHVSWMPQDIVPVRGLTVREQVAYAGWLGGLTAKEAQRRTATTLEQVSLSDKADSRSDSLSGGQLRRLGLAESLVLQADYLLLDEPTAGLDPAQRANFRQVLLNLPPCGLVVSTHQIDDIADVFDRVAVIVAGTILFDGSVRDFHTLGQVEPGSRASTEQAFMSFLRGADH
ncbi:ABC transporter ATP-binding protein [Micromonospora sp. NBC_01813]|uniref:ABC transporter ATP-binding protein n=1 Tax=Micromonospora sp. NBC_01813 TaxID=2975988 RepID=UPI002DDB3BAB|nr:ATP-binding cassette domain-containing protein [Micromonospora sp. NBC_01813]WSA08020.1 ATP-binding cassette domain-containing protein [Micromonospora sp. NBC_01813]